MTTILKYEVESIDILELISNVEEKKLFVHLKLFCLQFIACFKCVSVAVICSLNLLLFFKKKKFIVFFHSQHFLIVSQSLNLWILIFIKFGLFLGKHHSQFPRGYSKIVSKFEVFFFLHHSLIISVILNLMKCRKV